MRNKSSQLSTLNSQFLRKRLLAWFRRERRWLPWRGERDPYRIWVSEVMLQQTTVAAVLPRYEAFLRRFPDLAALSRAREESVLAAWSGLGYYARARHLHQAAREIARRHGGRLPRDAAALRRLSGFGEYMAAAVASLAYGAREPAADANVTRVLSRVFALEAPSGSRRLVEAVRLQARRLLPRRRPGDGTAALMDLGQLLCTPRRPNCSACPLAAGCRARRRKNAQSYPRRRARPPVARVAVAAACARRGGRALLVRRDAALLRGLWQFPFAEAVSAAAARRRLERAVAALGLRLDGDAAPGAASHTIVRRRLRIAVYPAVPAGRANAELRGPSSIRWFTPAGLASAAVPTLTRKIAAAAGFLDPASTRGAPNGRPSRRL